MWTASIQIGDPSPFFLHSRYDPASEAVRFATSQLSNIEKDVVEQIVIYGVGCGHHIAAILEQTLDLQVSIEVWETNVSGFLEVERSGALNPIINNSRLMLVVSTDLHVFADRVKMWQGGRVHVIVHEPSLKAVPLQLESLKGVLQNYQMQQNSAIAHRELMQDNFKRNTVHFSPSLSTFEVIDSVPAVLISAGPSLAKTLDLLPSAAEHCLLGAVGTVVPLLHRKGIRPDFVVMTDPHPRMLEQLVDWEMEDIPLFFLSTVYWEVVEKYHGPKFILFQNGDDAAEKLALLRKEPLVQTGGSVATTLFSLARLLGLHSICLVGQDLAYTNNHSHVEGTPLHHQWEMQAKGKEVIAFDGYNKVVSPRNLLLYKKWFEEQARGSLETFYNATEGGAYIEGFKHITFLDYLKIVEGYVVKQARESFHRKATSAARTDSEA